MRRLGRKRLSFFRFELVGNVLAARGDFLIIDTLGTMLTDAGFGDNDTEIGLYDASGILIAENDDFNPPARESRLTFGAGGTAGDLLAGDYFLALGSFDTTFSSSAFATSSNSVATGSMVVNFDLQSSEAVNGDFNHDGLWNCDDINALTVEIVAGTDNLAFDMNLDGQLTLADITDAELGWLTVGGGQNPAVTGGSAFLAGDANLDGEVDGPDFLTWNANKFTSVAAWCHGDFNADGMVDGQDFLTWNANKFTSSRTLVNIPRATFDPSANPIRTIQTGEEELPVFLEHVPAVPTEARDLALASLAAVRDDDRGRANDHEVSHVEMIELLFASEVP